MLCEHFGLERDDSLQLVIPPIAPNDLCKDLRELSLIQIEAAPGNISLMELVLINYLLRSISPRRCFEIGTYDGRTTLNLAVNLPSEGQVFTLDLPSSQIKDTALQIDKADEEWINKEGSGARFAGTKWEARITQLYGDSATFDFSPYVNSIDFIFVDGAHTYEYVRTDSLTAIRLLRNGHGVILWHDYNFNRYPGVTKALNELYETDNRFCNMRHIRGTMLCFAHF
jgi:predicted O-methyltransferase YrrM